MPAIDEQYDLPSYLAFMLAREDIDLFFSLLIPHHPDYAALRAAYATETDPARRAKLALNMERWRWLPVDLGEKFLIVNAARFEVSYWKDGAKFGTWPVIVGKPKTPTPTFAAFVKGVTFNPWWNVPQSIVAESVGSPAVRRLNASGGFPGRILPAFPDSSGDAGAATDYRHAEFRVKAR